MYAECRERQLSCVSPRNFKRKKYRVFESSNFEENLLVGKENEWICFESCVVIDVADWFVACQAIACIAAVTHFFTCAVLIFWSCSDRTSLWLKIVIVLGTILTGQCFALRLLTES